MEGGKQGRVSDEGDGDGEVVYRGGGGGADGTVGNWEAVVVYVCMEYILYCRSSKPALTFTDLSLGAKRTDLPWVYEGHENFQVLPTFGESIIPLVHQSTLLLNISLHRRRSHLQHAFPSRLQRHSPQLLPCTSSTFTPPSPLHPTDNHR